MSAASMQHPDHLPHGDILSAGREWLGFAAVVLVHLAALAGISMSLSEPALPVTPPAVVGVLVAPTPPVEATPPKPLPVKPPPKPRPVVRPKPVPIPKAPPSERAVAPPPAEPETEREESLPDSRPAMPAPAAPAPAAPAPAPVTPPRIDASHLNNPAPAYPVISRRMGEEGRVLFDVYILADGTVGEVKLKRSSGYSRLDAAALDALRRWHYMPARRGNEAIPYWYVQPINFSLDE